MDRLGQQDEVAGVGKQHELRAHPRLGINLPLECSRAGTPDAHRYRTITKNVSSSGLYFEADSDEFRRGMLLDLQLTVPPGDGHLPYPMRVHTVGEVVRVEELAPEAAGDAVARRFGVATRFRDPLQFVFKGEQ